MIALPSAEDDPSLPGLIFSALACARGIGNIASGESPCASRSPGSAHLPDPFSRARRPHRVGPAQVGPLPGRHRRVRQAQLRSAAARVGRDDDGRRGRRHALPDVKAVAGFVPRRRGAAGGERADRFMPRCPSLTCATALLEQLTVSASCARSGSRRQPRKCKAHVRRMCGENDSRARGELLRPRRCLGAGVLTSDLAPPHTDSLLLVAQVSQSLDDEAHVVLSSTSAMALERA